MDQVPIADMHNIVENTLDEIKPAVAKSYRDYRNYKKDFVKMIDDVYFLLQIVLYLDQVPDVGHHSLAAACEDGACAVAVKKRETKLVLECFYSVAHG